MARPLRIEFPGACYHVVQRGNSRFPVFGEDRDRELLLAKLVEFAERYQRTPLPCNWQIISMPS